MKKVLRIAGLIFTYIIPIVLVFLLHVYKHNLHWSAWVGVGVGAIGFVLLAWLFLRVKKRIDKRMNSLRDIIVKQEEGSDQHISADDFIAVKRKVYVYDKVIFILPFVLVYFIALYIEKAAQSVSVSVAYIAFSILIGAVCGFIGMRGK